MSIQEILEKVERKKTLTLNRQACIQVNKTVVDEENLRSECEKRNWMVRSENGMLIIG